MGAGGRPTKYKEEYSKQVYKLCLLGATDKDIADYFEVDESTINNWKNEHTEFFESIKRGKVDADATVAERLYNRAKGYDQKTDKIFQFQGEPVIVPTVEHVQPDTTAAIFWLKNRRPKEWRDKQEIETTGETTVNNKLDLSGLSVDQIKDILKTE
jgi:hypothetical protein